MVEMKKYKLNDVCLKITDGSHFSPKAVDFGYPMYSVKDMNEFGFNDSDYKMISEDDFKSLVAAGCRPQKDDVLIAKDGSYLKYAFVCKEEKDEVILSSIAILRPNKDIIDPTFFSFLLRNPSVKKSMKYYVSGTALPRIVLDNFKKMEINIPGLSEQKKIGDMLSTLDKRIENLRAQNRVLEQTAKTIYDYTFLQCAGHQTTYNKTLNRNIPAGWEIDNLYRIADFTNGLACQKYRPITEKEKLPVIKIREMHDGVTADTEFVRSDIPEKVIVNPGDLLFSWSASLEVMMWNGVKGGLNQHIFKVTPKEYFSLYFVYFQLKDYIGNFKRMAEARKTTMGHITTDHLNQSRIAIPDEETMKKFNAQVTPLFQKQLVNTKQIETLTTQRNTLLPLLMTGQIEVM